MLTKTEKKNNIRKNIIEAAKVYSRDLAGKTFLYVYGQEYFEVSFPIDHFLHLTGVETKLSAKDFYRNSKKSKLTNKQFYFNSRHPYSNAKKKLPCLIRLPELTKDVVCILKNMNTLTVVYNVSVTNLEFTLGLIENTDLKGKKINDYYLPMTLGVGDNSLEKSSNAEIVDFIFMRDACCDIYNHLIVCDENKKLPEKIMHLVDEEILEYFGM